MKIAPSPITQQRLLDVIKELLRTNEVAGFFGHQEAGYEARGHARALLDQAEREAS